jgi:MoaA/NifB/PqqE/SkfB family radical SAM enzyme
MPRLLNPDEFRLLCEKLRGHTEYLYFHLMGEPLLHPQLEELLQIAGELGFHVMITTNGTLLREKGQLLLDAPAVHKVNLSLQSFEGNLGGHLEDYLRGCVDFVKKAAARGILCEFRLWNQGGLESRNEEILAILANSFPEPWGLSRNGRKLAERVWLDPGERFDWPDLSLQEQGERRFCYGLRDQIGVLCDGTVVPCCLDHDGDIPLGNLFESNLDEILSGPRARAIYEGFSRREAVEPLCRRCGYARRFDK